MIPQKWFEEATRRITPYVVTTPLTYDAQLGLYLKWENHQITGSFKARGALNKVLSLQPWEQALGLVAASAGNHGLGVAIAAKIVNTKAIIFCSENAVKAKVDAIRAEGAEVKLVPGNYADAELAGKSFATSSASTWISPYNDGQVIAGQGTLALEVINQLPPNIEPIWLVPVGGGGLIAGIGVVLGARSPKPKLIGVQSEASQFFHAIYYQGTQQDVSELPSLADGLAGEVENNSITIPLVRKYVDDILLVSEAEIYQAVQYAWHQYHEKIEGSAAVVLAAIMSAKISQFPAVLIISGGNIQPEVHAKIIKNHTN
jgi:threonine dehydratase